MKGGVDDDLEIGVRGAGRGKGHRLGLGQERKRHRERAGMRRTGIGLTHGRRAGIGGGVGVGKQVLRQASRRLGAKAKEGGARKGREGEGGVPESAQ